MKKYKIGLYEKAMPDSLSWKEKLTVAKNAGYDYLEISIDASEEKISRIYMGKEERMDIIRDMNEVGLPIRSMCVSALTKYALGEENLEVQKRGMEIARKAIELADDFGIRVVMIPGYDIYFGESSYNTKRMFMENIQHLTEIAACCGVIIGFETMENEFMNTVGKSMKYITLCNSSYLKLYPDIGNLTNAAVLYKHDILEDMELGKGNIVALHLKETVPGVFREVPYGTGHVDFPGAVEKAWKLGVRRYVTEFWYNGRADWKQDIHDVCTRFKKILDEVS